MNPRKPRTPAARPAAPATPAAPGAPAGGADGSAPAPDAAGRPPGAESATAPGQGAGVRITSGRVTALPAPPTGAASAGKAATASAPRRGEPGLLTRWRSRPPGLSHRSAGGPDTTVVSFPEPARRKTRRRLLIAAGIVVVLLAVMMSVIFLSPALAVKTITVEGAELTDSAALSEALEPLQGIPLARIGERDVEAHVGRFPAVESVEIVAKPPSELHVRIIEHTPVAVLKDGKKFVLIDESGKALASVRKRSEAKLPLIVGAKAAEDPDVFASITGVLGALPPKVLKQLDHASARSVDSVELQLANGQKVVWGNPGQKELKATVLQALLQAKGVKGKASVIDVSTPTRPVTR